MQAGDISICGIILKISYPSMGDTSKIEILGKSMLDWVALSLSESMVAAVDYSKDLPLLDVIKPNADKESEFTVVLFSDTPLITRKTVLDAVYDLKNSGENALTLSRGYVFKTDYLLRAEKFYGDNHRFFDEEDFLTAFSYKQAALVSEVLKNRIINYHMGQGVQFHDPASAFIGCDVVIEKGAVIAENNSIKGRSVIKAGVHVNKGNTIEDSVLDEDCTVLNSVISHSYVGKRTRVGPYAHLRDFAKIGDDCRIGNFVEVKNSSVGDGCKIAHLAYIGDAVIGKSCNIGCGVVFCNYDGKNKHQTYVGDNAFIGSNSNLVAPVNIGSNAFIAAGSTITDDVPDSALGIARAKQAIKRDWNKTT